MKADWSRERALLSNRRALALFQTLIKNEPDGHGAFCVKIIKGSLVEEGEWRRRRKKRKPRNERCLYCVSINRVKLLLHGELPKQHGPDQHRRNKKGPYETLIFIEIQF